MSICEPQPTSSFFPILVQINRSFILGGCGQEDGLPCPLSSNQSLLYHIPGTITSISHSLQLRVEEAKFLVSMPENLGATFFYSAPSQRMETLLHSGKVENTWTKMALTLAHSQDTGAMMGEASGEIQRLAPCPVPRTVAHRACPGEAAHGKESSVALPKGTINSCIHRIRERSYNLHNRY